MTLDPRDLREIPEPEEGAPLDEPVPADEKEATAEPEPDEDEVPEE